MKTYIFRLPLLLLLFSFFLLQGCKDDEDLHPEVQTLAITVLSPSSAILNGEIISKGKFNVLEYGFVYGFSSDLSETRGTVVSLGKDASMGKFSKEVSGLSVPNYYYDRTLYTRAFLKNEKGTVFGPVSSATLPSPNVKGIMPSSGKAGDRITINGDFYTNNINEVEVTFGGISAKVVEVTPSKVTVEVPVGIVSYYYYSSNQVQVTLKMANQTYQVTSSFRIIPTVKDFTPKSGIVGTSLTILGDNLPSSYYYSSYKVFLGQQEVSVSNYSTSGIQVIVPHTITTEKFTITVVVDGTTTVLPGEFTVTPPTVTSISPASGLSGSSFSVFGSNFPTSNYYYNQNISIKLGTVPAGTSYVSSGQLTASVPQDLPEGKYKVYVTSGPHTVEAPQQYEVISPSITGFSPTSGGIGREVILSGVFLAGQYYTVSFGSVNASGYSTSSNSLRVNVPQGLEAGKVKISLKHGTKTLTAEEEFTVLSPSISSFSPASGVAGSVVNITVSGFTPTNWTTVKFGTVTTSVVGISESTIRAVVPSNVSGAMKISVIHSGQTMISKDNFTVTN